jgi:hypothetical protein
MLQVSAPASTWFAAGRRLMRCVSRIGSDLPNEAVHFQSPERAALNGKCTEASPRPGPKAERSDFSQYNTNGAKRRHPSMRVPTVSGDDERATVSALASNGCGLPVFGPLRRSLVSNFEQTLVGQCAHLSKVS